MAATAAVVAEMKGKAIPIITFDHKRDAYGFAVRPQHLQRYREYANIYKEEEDERSEGWKNFLQRQAEAGHISWSDLQFLGEKVSPLEDVQLSGNELSSAEQAEGDGLEEAALEVEEKKKGTKVHPVEGWLKIRPALKSIEQMLIHRVKKKNLASSGEQNVEQNRTKLHPVEEGKASEGDSDDEFYDVERTEPVQEAPSGDSGNADSSANLAAQGDSLELLFPWKEELECLVRGGVPMFLRGELWQAFVGVDARRKEGYYSSLLDTEANTDKDTEVDSLLDGESLPKTLVGTEKWKGQIEKDLPRTFPGHPALDEDGRNTLRRILRAYGRHNPSVGYCQAMNFFAGLLLLLMPEENAFWTLVGMIDDYFDGYYSEDMIESQVDQLVLEDLVRERFPRLVNHLDYLGVNVAWVTGPWFLSIFVNMLPWESVLRVWDVLLYDGNRQMLFRTALALLELYGPAIVTTKDAGDAVTLMQSLAGSTFDSSQLVLTACMGYQAVNETKLQELRSKHRPTVLALMDERSNGHGFWRDSKGLATKLYSFNHDAGSLVSETKRLDLSGEISCIDNGELIDGNSENGTLSIVTVDTEVDSLPDFSEQLTCLKGELCRLLDEKRSAVLRAEELETALMEMVKQDNRRLLSAKVEHLEQEVLDLRQTLSDKQEQEQAMLQVLMRVEQEQKVTEDARLYAEQDAAAQRHAVNVLQEKYEEAMTSLAQMENRAVMAETMLEATLQYQSSQTKALSSPRTPSADQSPRTSQESPQDIPSRKVSLLSRPFGLGWRDKNKGKPNNPEEATEVKPMHEQHTAPSPIAANEMNGHAESENSKE